MPTLRLLIGRCLKPVGRALVAYGTTWINAYDTTAHEHRHESVPPSWADPPERDGPPAWDAPPAGHPERLRPDVPLSPAEWAMELQMRDTAGPAG